MKMYHKFYCANNITLLGRITKLSLSMGVGIFKMEMINSRKVSMIVLIPKGQEKTFEDQLGLKLQRPKWEEII